LGLTIAKDEERGMDINGVLFRITEEMLADFDRREVGYDRVEIKMEDIDGLRNQVQTKKKKKDKDKPR
jgi:hypothetical protein